MLDLYKNIKLRRKDLKMTQTDLAHKVGYSEKSMIARIESGKINLPLSKIKEFSDALQCTPSELMGWSAESDESFNDSYERGNKLAQIDMIMSGCPVEAYDKLIDYACLLSQSFLNK